MTVLSFSNAYEADQHFKILSSAVNDGMFCNGKASEILIKNVQTIFYFATRVKMFRAYINQYAKFIEKQKSKIKK